MAATDRLNEGMSAGNAVGGETTDATMRTASAGSRTRRIAFHIVSWLMALGVLVLFIFGLMELVLMWLPDQALMSMIDDLTAADLQDRGHFNSIGIVAWAFVPAVVVQVRRPQRRVAAMLLAVAVVVVAAVVYGLSGSLRDWLIEDVGLLVPVLLLAVLHPRAAELVRRPRWDATMGGLVALAVVPWLVYAFGQAQLQWRNAAGDTHAGLEHWAVSALMAVTIVLAGLIGATDHAGWRLPAWFAALASMEYGFHSLVFPDVPSNAPTLWAVTLVAWGGAYAAAIIRRSRRSRASADMP